MLVKEFYDQIGGNYESVLKRLSKDEIIKKFIIKFISEPSYSNMCRAVEEEDYEKAFSEGHSFKGICANMSFERLEKSAGALTEYLRKSSEKQINKEQCLELVRQVSEDYNVVVDTVKKLESE